MSVRRIAFWALVVLTLAIYFAIVAWTLPTISQSASGLRPFDLRPTGYSAAEARDFLAALSDAGRAIYLGPQAWLDGVYPALLALVLILSFQSLIPARWRALRIVLQTIALAGSGFDYLENARIKAMLVVAPDQLGDAQIAAASFATVMKSALGTLAFCAIIALLALSLWKNWRGIR